ncbi:MAG TPA: NAD(P)-dependent oxidoreductase, partial [Rectinemataceae bacterium]|nr:NAD(P)-dependent oxidoreductase [Rectinemataceae bacterium]
ELDRLLESADIVSLHLPLMESTKNLIGARELSLMKPSAILINTSRGEIISTDALVKALGEKSIAGAGLDVFDPEPLPPDSPLLSMPNVVLTPHVGGNTADMSIDMVDICSRNILTIAKGNSLASNVLVNGQFLDSRAQRS